MKISKYNKEDFIKKVFPQDHRYLEHSFSDNVIELTPDQYNKINKQIFEINQQVKEVYAKENDIQIARVDCIIDGFFNLKICEINFDNPGMCADVKYQNEFNNDYSKKDSSIKYPDTKSLFTNMIKRENKEVLFLQECNLIDRSDIKTMIQWCLKEKIDTYLIEEKIEMFEYPESLLITLKNKKEFEYLDEVMKQDKIEIINKETYKIEDNVNLIDLYVKSEYVIPTYATNKNLKYPYVAKKRISNQGLGVNIIRSKKDEEKIEIKEECIYQDFVENLKEKDKYYTMTFFIVDNQQGDFLFLESDTEITDEMSKMCPYKVI